MIKKLVSRISDKKMRRYAVLLIMAGIIVSSIHISFTLGQETGEETSILGGTGNIGFVAAALAIGIAGVGAGIAIYGATSAGAAAIVERPESFVYILIFAGLGEGIAIYGLVVAIMILGKI